ncbi:hypothetical protein OJ997_28180 [Solirubrobacter phytolaccae]|uniref:Uncharacterized protein n=1 Tax=Solirubrobacter phytolaccae TaxID=1404360 RepID=A0A9X3SDY4_9ACTN|nr:hypothetical protein [Solirubrobacter phytolaccae]MDA0184220.1 hypothetical protein [Solirubrobacter phytolaccae]
MRKRILPLTLAALAATATVATAQVLNDDHDRGPVAGVAKTTDCGPALASTVRTVSGHGSTSSVPWAPIPTLQVPIELGGERCIKVLLTAETSCTGFAGAPNDYCYVRALVDGVPMDPDGANFQAIDSEDASGDGHAFEWVKRVPPGNHVVSIEQRVGNGATTFTHDDKTMDVQIHG